MTGLPNGSDSKPSRHVHQYATGFATKVWMPNWAASTASEASQTRSKIFKKTPVTNHEKINAAMIAKLLIASCLVASTVMIHAVGLGMTLSHVLRSTVRPDTRVWSITWLLIRIAALLMALTTVGTAWCSYQSAAWTRQSNRLLNEFNALERRGVCCASFRPESFSLLSAGCLATVSN